MGLSLQGAMNMWENGMDEFSVFNSSNGQVDSTLQSVEFTEDTSNASVGIETNQMVMSFHGAPKKWESNMDEFAIFTQSNGKRDTNQQNGNLNEFSSEPAYLGFATNNIFSSFDIISDLNVKDGQDFAVGTKFGHEYKECSAASNPVSTTINDDSDFDENNWEFQDASEKTRLETNHSTAFKAEHISTDVIQNNVLRFYYTLKEAALCLAGHHLDDLKVSAPQQILFQHYSLFLVNDNVGY